MYKVAVVGKPNVGKSAFFRALTLAHAESGNFPFTTIEANSGIGYIKIEDPAKSFGKSSFFILSLLICASLNFSKASFSFIVFNLSSKTFVNIIGLLKLLFFNASIT